MPSHILVLEPYYGGSHRAFLDGWQAHSRHRFTVFGLPARKWKWRMRHAALTLRNQIVAATEGVPSRPASIQNRDATADAAIRAGDPCSPDANRAAPPRWDVLFCSDMLNLAEFIGLAPPSIQRLPRIAYFHENQLTHPFRHATERDFHFGFTNMTTAAAATEVWFNSAFHRDTFLDALRHVLKRMPDFVPLDVLDAIRAKARIHPPGIEPISPRAAASPTSAQRPPGPLRILWAARWEHDKNPDDFFNALYRLHDDGVPFRLSAIGQQFRDQPIAFDEADAVLHDRIDRWGHQPTRADYLAALHETDVFVSTAIHEFFGISAVEALAAGCYPLLPHRLAYPELVGVRETPAHAEYLYDGTVDNLARRLRELAHRLAQTGSVWTGAADAGVRIAERFHWPRLAPVMDTEIDALGQTD